jgi:radical SAM protein with 4Fe4S-binding SPASM domain
MSRINLVPLRSKAGALAARTKNTTNVNPEAINNRTHKTQLDDSFFRQKRVHGGTFANTFMYIDESCNMSCDHCYLGDRLVNPEAMALEEIRQTLDYFKRMGTQKCTIIGGEPTQAKLLRETVTMINERGFDCILDTNGWFNAERVLDQFEVHELEYISFSLDGSTKELHDANRMPGSFDRVIRNIRYASERGFECRIIPTITRVNQHDAENILKLACELGVRKVNFHTVTLIGNAKDGVEARGEEPLELTPDEWIQFYRNLEVLKTKYDIKIWYPPTYAYEDDVRRFNQQGYAGCLGRTVDRLSVFPGGTAYVCSLFFDEDKEHGGKTNGYFGTIDDGKFRINASEDNEMNHFFQNPEKCDGCSYADVCHMGCPSERKIGLETFCGRDKPENKLIPMCRLWKAEVLCD